MSLRGRLVATLLALAFAGMLVLGIVTYASQSSYLNDRIDDQTKSATPVIGRQLVGANFRDPDGDGRVGGYGRRPGDRPDPNEVDLPSGTYGELRDASGAKVGRAVTQSYGEEILSPPRLPAVLKGDRLFTADAKDGDGRFRVRVSRSPFDGSAIVVAIPLWGVDNTLHRLLLVEGLVIGGVLLLLGGLSWLLVRLELRPLERIGATADAIAGGQMDSRVDVTSSKTEVGRLGVALNAMLDRLETAFAERRASEDRLRTFLADASHELRTPLASIRGYAELFRIGAARSPEDTEKAMKRIEDESARMGTLVEDLLTLARLDQVRDRATEPVDLAALAEDAVEDARATDADRVIEAAGDDEALVVGDPDQLRQVLANLVRNALVHTPPGTAITVTTNGTPEEVVLRVSDRGPGLPTDDPDELFDRFWRAEGGRERGRAGAGLGLAIVSGIVSAHGGTVGAANAPEGGAVFTVRLPRA